MKYYVHETNKPAKNLIHNISIFKMFNRLMHVQLIELTKELWSTKQFMKPQYTYYVSKEVAFYNSELEVVTTVYVFVFRKQLLTCISSWVNWESEWESGWSEDQTWTKLKNSWVMMVRITIIKISLNTCTKKFSVLVVFMSA